MRKFVYAILIIFVGGIMLFGFPVNTEASKPRIISHPVLRGGNVGNNYEFQLEARGGTPPYRWLTPGTTKNWNEAACFAGLPHVPELAPLEKFGFSLVREGEGAGKIRATPIEGEENLAYPITHLFLVAIIDAENNCSWPPLPPFSIEINDEDAAPPVMPVITTGERLPDGTVNNFYNLIFKAAGGCDAKNPDREYEWQVTHNLELPKGLVFDGLHDKSWAERNFFNGTISGTPTEPIADFVFGIRVRDICGNFSGPKMFYLTILPEAENDRPPAPPAPPRERMPLELDWPVSPAGTKLTGDSNLTHLIKYLYEWGIALGGLIAFIALIIAGFLYLTSVGDPGKMKDAMDRIKSAFFGLVLLLGSFLILHTINPELTVLEIPKIPAPERTPEVPEVEIAEPKRCKQVKIFSKPNYEGAFQIVREGGNKCLNIGIGAEIGLASINSIRIKPDEKDWGLCRVEFFLDKACRNPTEFEAITSSSKNLRDTLRLKDQAIYAIRVKIME